MNKMKKRFSRDIPAECSAGKRIKSAPTRQSEAALDKINNQIQFYSSIIQSKEALPRPAVCSRASANFPVSAEPFPIAVVDRVLLASKP
jgi:hypothetical protein